MKLMSRVLITAFTVCASLTWAQAEFGNKLIQAVNEESAVQVKNLSKNKDLLNQKDQAGHNALYHAVSLNNPKIVKILLQAGASTTETYNETKESILFEASRLGSKEVVDLLLTQNPKLLEQKNNLNESVLFEAVRSNHSVLAELYIQKGLNAESKNKDGKKPADFLSASNEKMAAVLKKSTK